LGWWTSACAAILFAFHLNYVPVHLATQIHASEILASVAHLVFHQHHHGSNHNEESHHVPHPASDHAQDLALRVQSAVDGLIVFALPSDTQISLVEVLPGFRVASVNRIKPPGESPPDPLQPRAPPRA
jgi:hypothetical protein